MSSFPFFHVAGIVIGSSRLPLYVGGTVYPLLAFDPVKAMQVISQRTLSYLWRCSDHALGDVAAS